MSNINICIIDFTLKTSSNRMKRTSKGRKIIKSLIIPATLIALKE